MDKLGNWEANPTVRDVIKKIEPQESRKSVIEYIESLEKHLRRLEAFQRSVNEALNRGSGAYRP